MDFVVEWDSIRYQIQGVALFWELIVSIIEKSANGLKFRWAPENVEKKGRG